MALLTPLDGPAGAVRSLCIIYVIRTLSLLLLAWSTTFLFPSFSPLGYDTSSTHVTGDNNLIGEDGYLTTSFVERLVTALTRWDAIYFASIVKNGHRWEQEWAFGVGQSYLVHGFQWILNLFGDFGMSPSSQILFLSICSCGSHLVSAVVLYHLTAVLFETALPKGASTLGSGETPKIVAFVAATLHILSPAGIFLIAPYNEPVFSVLSFSGYYLYSYAIKNTAIDGQHGLINEVFLLLSGLLFGVSGLFRSNGIINGVLFVFEVLQSFWRLTSGTNPPANIRLFLVSGISGALVGVPMVWRQYQGWSEYCATESSTQRVWCSKTLPSIYSFVQSHYWGVGLLKYWTPGNIPLFLLAAPTLYVLFKTSLNVINIQTPTSTRLYSLDLKYTNKDLLFRLMLPQLLLAVLAVTNYHVQIIARLSSGLPIWYIVAAAALVQTATTGTKASESKESSKLNEGGKAADEALSAEASWVRPAVRFFLGYQVVQAVLYGGFLPPA
ncbi:ER membrane glycoprotein subunit of the GPI transamidase complex-like protein [Orbilia oligospora]|uniref:GPI mannosyltransferase 2 n=1 Tax=Orbilia oligospora TaxID=2813651 RepID=A0A7C8K914_ORBOL|nr:ER membrane glycoprotein subunit of the GPI transamidase complex-like protein [Orbilia oligospora]